MSPFSAMAPLMIALLEERKSSSLALSSTACKNSRKVSSFMKRKSRPLRRDAISPSVNPNCFRIALMRFRRRRISARISFEANFAPRASARIRSRKSVFSLFVTIFASGPETACFMTRAVATPVVVRSFGMEATFFWRFFISARSILSFTRSFAFCAFSSARCVLKAALNSARLRS